MTADPSAPWYRTISREQWKTLLAATLGWTLDAMDFVLYLMAVNTIRGEFAVQRKIVNPVWTKPDWAFIEDGEPIPRKFADRLDPDVLGDYAMAIGDGYLIHGSLYKRTLGMSVTHGCIRVGDEDLEAIYKAAQLGTKVYII